MSCMQICVVTERTGKVYKTEQQAVPRGCWTILCTDSNVTGDVFHGVTFSWFRWKEVEGVQMGEQLFYPEFCHLFKQELEK